MNADRVNKFGHTTFTKPLTKPDSYIENSSNDLIEIIELI